MISYHFLSLPNEVLSLLVSNWFPWKAVTRLDIALCNYVHRQEWMELLKNYCIFGSVSSEFWRMPSNGIVWHAKRQIRTKKLFSTVGRYPTWNCPSVGFRILPSLLQALKYCQCINFAGLQCGERCIYQQLCPRQVILECIS